MDSSNSGIRTHQFIVEIAAEGGLKNWVYLSYSTFGSIPNWLETSSKLNGGLVDGFEYEKIAAEGGLEKKYDPA